MDYKHTFSKMADTLKKYWYLVIILIVFTVGAYQLWKSNQSNQTSNSTPETSITQVTSNSEQPIRPLSVVSAVNELRLQSQLPELETESRLFKSATAKANDMCDRGYFSHESPTGLNPWYWLQQSQFEFEFAGENLARHVTELPELITSWKESPTHLENMIDSRFTLTGVAVRTCVIENVETMVVVQHFASQTPPN